MTQPNSSEIIVLLDRSGSMRSIQNDMEGGFDTFIEQQRKAEVLSDGQCRVSLFQFDDQFETVYTGQRLAFVPPLRLIPRGNTALWDAVGQAITITGERFAQMAEWNRPAKVVFVLITDGHENASRLYSHARVRAMIEHQEQKYNWGFIYLGSSPTTHADAADIGIRAVSSYVASGVGVRGMSSFVGAAVANYCNNASMDFHQLSANIPSSIPAQPPKA